MAWCMPNGWPNLGCNASACRVAAKGPLPKTASIELTFACPVTLKADLDRYASLHAQTYGEALDATTSSPHISGLPYVMKPLLYFRLAEETSHWP
jgi:hypothetical protein